MVYSPWLYHDYTTIYPKKINQPNVGKYIPYLDSYRKKYKTAIVLVVDGPFGFHATDASQGEVAMNDSRTARRNRFSQMLAERKAFFWGVLEKGNMVGGRVEVGSLKHLIVLVLKC